MNIAICDRYDTDVARINELLDANIKRHMLNHALLEVDTFTSTDELLICRWHRQDDLLDIVFLDAFLDTVPITDNLDSLNISSDLIRIIVYDTDNLLIQIFTVLDLCDQTSSGLSSADDHDFLSL